MVYVKRQAYEAADASGAVVYEIKSTERTAGTLGFWWCGRFGMHRWEMPIEPINIDLTTFDSVTICFPDMGIFARRARPRVLPRRFWQNQASRLYPRSPHLR